MACTALCSSDFIFHHFSTCIEHSTHTKLPAHPRKQTALPSHSGFPYQRSSYRAFPENLLWSFRTPGAQHIHTLRQLLFLSLESEPQNTPSCCHFFHMSLLSHQDWRPQGWPMWIGAEPQCTPHIIYALLRSNFCFSSIVYALSWQLLPWNMHYAAQPWLHLPAWLRLEASSMFFYCHW